MKKKTLFWAAIALIAIGLLAFANYVPFWVSLSTAVAFIAGGAAGWFLHGAYDKYFRGNAAASGKERSSSPA